MNLQAIIELMDIRRKLEIVNFIDSNGFTLLHAAAYHDTFKIAKYLISLFRNTYIEY